tara:strand:+ start:551 stop:1213 length:663 start_codon:yes stop_codon:yes gene_type:complete
MSNKIKKENKLITPERASVLFPTIISSFIVLVVISAFVIPKFINSNKVYFELKEFKRKKDELPNLKLQAISINEKLEKLNNEKLKMLDLISGTTNLETLLARLGNLAEDNNFKIISLVQGSLIKYVEPNNNQNNANVSQNSNVGSDNLLVEGLKKNIVEVSFVSSFKNLLSFLNEVEFQENVILIRDINLDPVEIGVSTDKNEDEVLLNGSLQMIIYGKI